MSDIFFYILTYVYKSYDLKLFLLKVFSYLPCIKRSWRGSYTTLERHFISYILCGTWYLGEIKYHFQKAQMYAGIWPYLHHEAKLAAFMRLSFVLDIFCYITVCGCLYNCEVTLSWDKNQYLEKHLDPSHHKLDFILVWIKSQGKCLYLDVFYPSSFRYHFSYYSWERLLSVTV